MCGNVSTYELNVEAMTKMVEGKLMPRPVEVLSSLIAITYIGVGRLPKSWLHSTFRVRRHHISRALAWLKDNNPKYYGDIIINTCVLDRLPEDDIPDEILGVIRQSTDEGLIDQESAGYVRTEEEMGAFIFHSTLQTSSLTQVTGDTGGNETVTIPAGDGDPGLRSPSQDVGMEYLYSSSLLLRH